MHTDFHNSFTCRLVSKFAIKSILNISSHLTNVAILPCEILMSDNSDNLKHYRGLVINDKSQGSEATHLRCGGYVLLLCMTLCYVSRRKNF